MAIHPHARAQAQANSDHTYLPPKAQFKRQQASPNKRCIRAMSLSEKGSDRGLALSSKPSPRLWLWCSLAWLTVTSLSHFGGNDQRIANQQSAAAGNCLYVTFNNIKNTDGSNNGIMTDIKIGGGSLRSPPVKVPHKIILLDTRYATMEELPQQFLDNVRLTIGHYREFWQEPDASVIWLGDEDCQTAINATKPELVSFYVNENIGKWKANICRIAALSIYGGYYFDTDMKSVTPVPVAPDTSFCTPIEAGNKGLFNSFIAAEPGHVILNNALQVMLEFYHKKRTQPTKLGNMGTWTLQIAFSETPTEQRGKVVLLHETHAPSHILFEDFPRQNGLGLYCDYIIYGPEGVVHFYSRFPGAGDYCRHPGESSTSSSTLTSSSSHYSHTQQQQQQQQQVRAAMSAVSRAKEKARADSSRSHMIDYSLKSILCPTQTPPNRQTHSREMSLAKEREEKMNVEKRCINGHCRMTCGDDDNFMVPMPPKGTLLGIHQIAAIRCAMKVESDRLGRAVNLLVWGLGNDSPYWHNTTTGRVSFVEDSRAWYDKMIRQYPHLDAALVKYDTVIDRDIEKLGTKEFEHDMVKALDGTALDEHEWDVMLVDAPPGCSGNQPGRFAATYTSRHIASRQRHGIIIMDDYQRDPEHQIADHVLDGDRNCSSSSSSSSIKSENTGGKGGEGGGEGSVVALCAKRVGVLDRIHPDSRKYIEKVALFTIGESFTPSLTAALKSVIGIHNT